VLTQAERAHAEQTAVDIAHALCDEAERLRHAFDAAARRWVDVTFTGPLAELFALRMEERIRQVNSAVTKMGGMAEELLRKHDDPAQHGHHSAGGDGPQGFRGGSVDGSHLPGRYRRWLPYVEHAARKYHLDPALILAVMDRETGDPKKIGLGGRNVIGDGGHGHGLMQIDDGSHGAWLRAHHNGMDPASNIDYGASILAANIRQFPGNLTAAVAAYNAGAGAVSRVMREGLSPDAATTGHNYGSDVLRRRDYFRRRLR
jgi:hypothetical protein